MKKDRIIPYLEKVGFKVTANIGYRNGVQTIVAYTATKFHHRYTATSLTGLYKAVRERKYSLL